MMAGNPNYWGMNGMHPQSHQLSNSLFAYGSNNNPLSESAQDFPVRSWSQLLLGGLGSGDDERLGDGLFQQPKKVENWEDGQQCNWSYHHQVVLPVSSPTSCVTNLSNNLNFTADEATKRRRHNQEHSSQCNSTSTGGGVSKKARVQQSSAQPILKVRKEKLGERITALHQLVSPFGKTDTASVLSEAIGYIRFLQGQIEALSSPYMRNSSVNSGHHHQSDSENGGTKDLKSRGLCLVPISCTENVENENGADYWAPAAFGGGF